MRALAAAGLSQPGVSVEDALSSLVRSEGGPERTESFVAEARAAARDYDLAPQRVVSADGHIVSDKANDRSARHDAHV